MPHSSLNADETYQLSDVGTGGTADEAALPGGLRRDEVFGLDQGLEFEPLVAGGEASRAAQSFDTLAEVTVEEGRYGLLGEVAAAADSNGEVRISIPGNDPVQFTGDIDVSLPFEGAVLLPGSTVRIKHQSTDGNSATNRGLITAREV